MMENNAQFLTEADFQRAYESSFRPPTYPDAYGATCQQISKDIPTGLISPGDRDVINKQCARALAEAGSRASLLSWIPQQPHHSDVIENVTVVHSDDSDKDPAIVRSANCVQYYFQEFYPDEEGAEFKALVELMADIDEGIIHSRDGSKLQQAGHIASTKKSIGILEQIKQKVTCSKRDLLDAASPVRQRIAKALQDNPRLDLFTSPQLAAFIGQGLRQALHLEDVNSIILDDNLHCTTRRGEGDYILLLDDIRLPGVVAGINLRVLLPVLKVSLPREGSQTMFEPEPDPATLGPARAAWIFGCCPQVYFPPAALSIEVGP